MGGSYEHTDGIKRFGYHESYTKLEMIGIGPQFKVYSVMKDGYKYAMKIPKFLYSEEMYADDPLMNEDLLLFEKSVRQWDHISEILPDDVIDLIDSGFVPVPWLVMELADGSFHQAIRENKVDVSDVYELLVSLQHIHDQGLVHRDIRAKNILGVNGRWKFTDISLHRFRATDQIVEPDKEEVVYLAPEQILPSSFGGTDRLTDLWHMGILLYIVLTKGGFPYHGEDYMQVIADIVNDGPDITGVDDRYLPILSKAFSAKKEGRYQSAKEFADALKAVIDSDRHSE